VPARVVRVSLIALNIVIVVYVVSVIALAASWNGGAGSGAESVSNVSRPGVIIRKGKPFCEAAIKLERQRLVFVARSVIPRENFGEVRIPKVLLPEGRVSQLAPNSPRC
jgi:hypothetical protein